MQAKDSNGPTVRACMEFRQVKWPTSNTSRESASLKSEPFSRLSSMIRIDSLVSFLYRQSFAPVTYTHLTLVILPVTIEIKRMKEITHD